MIAVACVAALAAAPGDDIAREPAREPDGVVAQAGDEPAAVPMPNARSGLLGWGVGLEVPMVGIMTGTGGDSRVGAGSVLGAALSWEVTPDVLARLVVSTDHGYSARSTVVYIKDGVPTRQRAAADWVGFQVGVGGAYLFRAAERPWTPYIGGDVLATLGGFSYHLDDALDKDLGVGDASLTNDALCKDCRHDSLGTSWGAAVRAGLRLSMLRWLASQAELQVIYGSTAGAPITNTLTKLNVHGVAESLFTVRATYSLRFGL